MDTVSMPYHDILSRAEEVLASKRKEREPLEKSYLKATVSGIGIAATIATETFTAVMAVHSNWQALSSGVDVGSQLQPLGFFIGVGMLSGHALLHAASEAEASDAPWKEWLRKFHFIPIVALIGGMGIFTALTVAQATGADDGTLGLSGKALSLAASSLFGLSFLACNKLVGIFLPTIKTILTGRAKLAEIRELEVQIQDANDCRTALEALQQEIAEDQKPDALCKWVAAEAAAVVGLVAAEAHDAYVSRAALEGLEIGPDDTVTVSPDTSLDALKARAEYLKSLDFTYFFNLLKKDTRHA